ncbi:serine/threonine protein kinase [Candidatus Woesearchaeota archaeon CG_4_10_14_0_2_um_filter_33_13]|nr:MAG: serine/threonine protein kinase [Candidatus Woesearchaeota archaeon CG_4_10_14_0_2_um_filter_33_13]
MVTRTSQERFRTDRGVFDAFTDRNLFELQSHGVYDEVISPLFVGKESNVFIAKKGKTKLILKIYRIQNCDFKRMFNYIKQDPRYDFLKNKRREIIFSWTQREYKNLLRAQKGNVRVPKVLSWKFNIIVEEFIGDKEPAPRLKDSIPKEPQQFFDEIIKQIILLYKSGLIHGDLSAFNILNHHDKPVLIDFSQSTLTKTPNAEELLKRDLQNVISFFAKLRVMADLEETLQKIKKEATKK